MQKLILGFVGEIASGKGSACDYFIKEYKADYFKFSNLLRETLSMLALPKTRKNLQRLSYVLRNEFGEDIFAKVITQKAKSSKNEIVVVDGIRRHDDVEYLRKLPNFYLINITANEKIRYQRVINRKENEGDNLKTFEEFLKDHEQNTELFIKEVAKEANFKIDNSGTIDKLFQKLEKLYQKIK